KAPEGETENNRQRLYNELGLDPDRVAHAGQVHGDSVKVVTKAGMHPRTDAMITVTRGVALAIQVADCAAVLLADPESHVTGAIHAGWRGAAANIVPKTIQKMTRTASARPEDMLVYIAPCISQHYFEVGPDVASLFPGQFVNTASFSKPHIDLRGFIHQQLLDAGIPEKQIEIDPGCTFRDAPLYYSYRREQEDAGRMLAIIRLK
ncbi:MAG: peptidoglycan editing factor PgeF, partial [Balneolaceae bacterium]